MHHFFMRKHLLALLQSLSSEVRAEIFLTLPLATLRAWTPDQEGVMAEYPGTMTCAEIQENLGGIPPELAACWGCLFLHVDTLGQEKRSLWGPKHAPAMRAAAQDYQQQWGLPPTPLQLTNLVYHSLQNPGASTPAPAGNAALPTPAEPTSPTFTLHGSHRHKEATGTGTPGLRGTTSSTGALSRRTSVTVQTCKCTGNCDTRCPARSKGGSCPNVATVNSAISGKCLPVGYRAARPLCKHCACKESGCTASRRPRRNGDCRGPYCSRHGAEHPLSPRAPWEICQGVE